MCKIAAVRNLATLQLASYSSCRGVIRNGTVTGIQNLRGGRVQQQKKRLLLGI